MKKNVAVVVGVICILPVCYGKIYWRFVRHGCWTGEENPSKSCGQGYGPFKARVWQV